MGLNALCLLAVGWAASITSLHGRAREGPAVEDPAHAAMRAAGYHFGETLVEAWLAAVDAAADPGTSEHFEIADDIRARAAQWSERLRNDGLNPRLTEHLVTTWVAAAHQASRERLRKEPRHASSSAARPHREPAAPESTGADGPSADGASFAAA